MSRGHAPVVDRGLDPPSPITPQAPPTAADHFAKLLALMATASGGKVPYHHQMRKKYAPITAPTV